MTEYKARLVVDPQSTPKFSAVPYSLKAAIEADLERMVKAGILEPVSSSEWASPIVAVPKSDDSVRICGDFKVSVNPSLSVDPLPKPEDLFSTLANGVKFTKLDLASAYQQVPRSR